jgi:Phage integrase, N-terminal SAM-like domain
MPKLPTAPSFAMLVQRFFTEHLTHHRAVSPRTVTAYGDTFRLLLQFAERHIGKSPTSLKLVDLDAKLVLAFLDHLERDRKNGARSRNARLAAALVPQVRGPLRPVGIGRYRAGAGRADEAVRLADARLPHPPGDAGDSRS